MGQAGLEARKAGLVIIAVQQVLEGVQAFQLLQRTVVFDGRAIEERGLDPAQLLPLGSVWKKKHMVPAGHNVQPHYKASPGAVDTAALSEEVFGNLAFPDQDCWPSPPGHSHQRSVLTVEVV